MMSEDQLLRLSRKAVIKASIDLEVQLSSVKGGGPTVQILMHFQERAAESLAALAIVDPEDPKAIRTLQNEVKRYDEFFADMRRLISDGVMFDRELSQKEREELFDMLAANPEGQDELTQMGLVDGVRYDA